jgi:hypothetical protein
VIVPACHLKGRSRHIGLWLFINSGPSNIDDKFRAKQHRCQLEELEEGRNEAWVTNLEVLLLVGQNYSMPNPLSIIST